MMEPFNEPKVSVVITCYNLGRFLAEAIQSVRRQTYKNFEIIVVNDCSIDNTKEVLENIQNKEELKIINLEKNLGQFGAFLEGLKVSSGQFVVMLDADDILLPDFLSVSLDVHMKTSVAFTSTAQFEIDENSTIISLNSNASPTFKNEGFEDKKMYVWIEAVLGYVTATQKICEENKRIQNTVRFLRNFFVIRRLRFSVPADLNANRAEMRRDAKNSLNLVLIEASYPA